MSTLLPFSSAFYLSYPCKSRWNETANSTAPNFSKGDSMYLKFSELEELCSYFTVICNSRLWHFLILSRQKKEIIFFKELLSPPGGLQENASWHIFRDLCRFSKKYSFATFLKILPNYINLKVKSSWKFNCP